MLCPIQAYPSSPTHLALCTQPYPPRLHHLALSYPTSAALAALSYPIPAPLATLSYPTSAALAALSYPTSAALAALSPPISTTLAALPRSPTPPHPPALCMTQHATLLQRLAESATPAAHTLPAAPATLYYLSCPPISIYTGLLQMPRSWRGTL
jgi:hypothetical protein